MYQLFLRLHFNVLFHEKYWKRYLYIFTLIHKTRWRSISNNEILNLEFVDYFKDKVSWYYISWRKDLSEEFITKFAEKLEWKRVQHVNSSNLSFLKTNSQFVYWDSVWIWNQHLTLSFLKDFKTVNFTALSRNRHLTIDIIEAFANLLDWYPILENYQFSVNFIKKHLGVV